NAQRARHHPHWLLATSTHNSKRSEDTRARLNVLSEMPAEWENAVLEHDAIGQRFVSQLEDTAAPSALDHWTLFQALVGISWVSGRPQAQPPRSAPRCWSAPSNTCARPCARPSGAHRALAQLDDRPGVTL